MIKSEECPRCPYCGQSAKLVDSVIVYGTSYGMIWDCRPCDAYVGTHRDDPDHRPLGRLANKELRAWKIRAHSAFDPLWKSGGMKRKAAYKWLSKRMGIDPDLCHIGMFDVEQCKQVSNICAQFAALEKDGQQQGRELSQPSIVVPRTAR